MNIIEQREPNYTINRNGQREYSEVRFTLADGSEFGGTRPNTMSPAQCRRRFREFLATHQYDATCDFHQIVHESGDWEYESAYDVAFDAKGNPTKI